MSSTEKCNCPQALDLERKLAATRQIFRIRIKQAVLNGHLTEAGAELLESVIEAPVSSVGRSGPSRKTVHLPLQGGTVCGHWPDKNGRLGELRGREEYSFTIKGKKADYVAMIDDNGCSKCAAVAEKRIKKQVEEMERSGLRGQPAEMIILDEEAGFAEDYDKNRLES